MGVHKLKTRWRKWSIAVLPLMIVVGYIYVFINGTPFGKAKARSEFERYLSRNFTQSIVIDNVKYDMEGSSYYANVHVKKNKNLQFQVSYFDKKIVDGYWESFWEQDINNKLGSEVAILFNHKATLSPDISLTAPLLKYMDRGDKIPDYFTLQKELESSSHLNELVSSTRLSIFFSYDYSNNQAENQKLYKLITIIKKEIPCDGVDFLYKSKMLTLENSDMQRIASFKDIPKYRTL